MTKLRNMLVAMIAIFALTTSAHSFEGYSVGVIYSDANFDTSGSETTIASGSAMQEKKLSKSTGADYGSLFGEYTFSQGSSIGIEYIPGDADLGKASRTQTAPVAGGAGEDGSGVITAKATASDHVTLYVEPTWMMNETFGVYLKGGASKVTITPSYTEAADIIQSTYSSQDVWGVMQGIGAKMYMGNFFFKLEHITTEYGEYVFQSTTGDKNTIKADIEQDATRVALAYNF
jgi:hypothetical protein